MIQMSPHPTMSCMEEYVKLLLFEHTLMLEFDAPGSQPPKEIEQHRRDKVTQKQRESTTVLTFVVTY